MTTERTDYRTDIDGLRAIAVLSVLIYHAHSLWMPGGFVGVDIFFVISGYLICGQIYREGLAGTFSFASFYARRARRILPALLFVIASFLLFGWFCLTPLEMKELGKESVAALLGVSNLYYFGGDDYFGPAADRHPLLMTWSLGVEEQFYVFFPLLMLGLLRWARSRLNSVILVLTILSFAGSLVLTALNAKAAFYLPPTRAWELGVGALIAIAEVTRGRSLLSSALAGPVGIVGAALLAASLFLYQPSMAFPGLFVLLPVSGAVLLLLAPQGAFSRVVLSAMPMRVAGWLSYSIYLWHWPIFYVVRAVAGEPELFHRLLMLLLPIPLAALSWRFVETPLRRRVLPQTSVLIRYAGVVGTASAAGLVLFMTNGLPQRLSPEARAVAENAAGGQAKQCLALYGQDALANPGDCVPAVAQGAGRILLLGDSHANALAPGLADRARTDGIAFGQMTKASCLPLVAVSRDMPDRPGHFRECLDFQARAFDAALRAPPQDVVVLAGFWRTGLIDPLRSADGRSISLVAALDQTLTRLAGRKVVLFLDVPAFSFDPYAQQMARLMPARSALAQLLGCSTAICGTGGAGLSANVLHDPSRAVLQSVAERHPGVRLVDPFALLCGTGPCRYAGNGQLYYIDFQHLAPEGARALVKAVPTKAL